MKKYKTQSELLKNLNVPFFMLYSDSWLTEEEYKQQEQKIINFLDYCKSLGKNKQNVRIYGIEDILEILNVKDISLDNTILCLFEYYINMANKFMEWKLHKEELRLKETKLKNKNLNFTPIEKKEDMFFSQHNNQNDLVNHPNHYTQGKVECIDALESATINLKGIEAVCTANVIKYMWRWKEKNGTQDLDKAKWYLEKLIGIVKDNKGTKGDK